MGEKNKDLAIKIEELNKSEQDNIKVIVMLYLKNINQIKKNKLSLLRNYFLNQLEFYGQNLAKYQIKLDEISKKYEEYIDTVIDSYNELFVNIQLELQETELNQKIAVLNLVKCCNIKEKILSDCSSCSFVKEYELKKYETKIKEFLEKKEQYDNNIIKCEENLKKCLRDSRKTTK